MKKTLAFVLTISALSTAAVLASASESKAPVDPNQTIENLKKGNQRFVAGKPAHGNQDVYRRKELAQGQHPSAIVLSCSDSRVPPEIVFDQGLGDIFTIRVAGNVLGADQVGSIEYAVEHLGTNLIVVMGHESCGAVKAAVETPKGQKVGSADLSALVATIHQNVEATGRKLAAMDTPKKDPTLRNPVKANVDGVTLGLTRRSALLRERVEKGQLKIVPAIYSLEHGTVDFW